MLKNSRLYIHFPLLNQGCYLTLYPLFQARANTLCLSIYNSVSSRINVDVKNQKTVKKLCFFTKLESYLFV